MHNVRTTVARASAVLVFTALLLLFLFVWPGVWRYEYYCFQTTNKDESGHVLGYGADGYRVDRLTGKFQSYDATGWH